MAAAVNCIFDEDEVCRKTDDDKFVYGLVVESSEYISSDEDDDDEEERLKKGTVRVAWHPDGKETVEDEKQLILADRSLMPGDIVRRFIEGKSSPRGFVQDMRVLCHINIKGTNKYIYNVDSRDICSRGFEDPSNKYFNNEHPDVTMDSWIGKIDVVEEAVTLLFTDGAMCRVSNTECLDMFDAINEQNEAADNTFSSEGIFYQGKILRGKLGDLERAEWIHSTKKHSSKAVKKNPKLFVNVRVEKAEVTCVKVHWLFRGFGTSTNNSMEVPPDRVTNTQLAKLQCLDWFAHCSIQVGDKATYQIKPSDDIVEVSPKNNYVPDVLSKESLVGSEGTDSKTSIRENTSEGSISTDALSAVSSQEALGKERNESVGEKCSLNNDAEKEPMECDQGDDKDDDDEYEDVESSSSDHNEEIVKTSVSKTSHSSRKKRKSKVSKKPDRRSKSETKFYPPFPTCVPGEKVPVEICYTYSEAIVMWQNGDIEEKIPSPELVPIHHLDELEFFPGDYVVSEKDSSSDRYGAVVKCDHIERTCLVRWMKVVDLAKGERPDNGVEEEEVSVYDIQDHPHFKFRPLQAVIHVGEPIDANESKHAAGQIVKLDPQGRLVVKWPDGQESKCYPQELYIAGEEMSDSESAWSTEDDSDSDNSDESMDSWETENEEEVDSEAEDKKNSGHRPIFMTMAQKKDLEQFLNETKDAVHSLEGFFAGDARQAMSYNCLKGVLSLYRKFQEWEKILKTSYFEDQKLKDLIEELKGHLQDEKRKEMNKKILHIHLSRHNRGTQTENTADKVTSTEESKIAGVDEGTMTGDGNSASTDNVTDCQGACSTTDQPDDSLHFWKGAELGSEDSSTSLQEHADMPNDTSAAKNLKLVSEKTKQKAEVCRKICHELISRIAIIKDLLESHRCIVTDQKATDTTSKFDKGDMPEVNTELSDSSAQNKITTEASNAEAGDTATASAPQEEWEKKAASHMKKLTRTTEEIEENFGVLEVLLGMDLNRSGAKSPELPAHHVNYKEIITADIEGLHLSEEVPVAQHFCSKEYSPIDTKSFTSALKKELKLLQSSLPKGIIVKGFEDRMDLFSVMIVGPPDTPYEDALFFFDVRLPSDYPKSPPEFHYISYCKDRLNPNLYDDGKVCVSLLGTWSGKGNEMWTDKSNLLQVLISIQGLILVAEPYYNEAGYEKQRGTQQGLENSKMYNEMAILKVVQSTVGMIENPPHSFIQEMTSHLRTEGPRMLKRLETWINMSQTSEKTATMGQRADNSMDQSLPSGAVSVSPPDEGNQQATQSVSDKKDQSQCSHTQGIKEAMAESRHDKGQTEAHSDVSPIQNGSLSTKEDTNVTLPQFPLFPASKGFCITMRKHLQHLQKSLDKLSN